MLKYLLFGDRENTDSRNCLKLFIYSLYTQFSSSQNTRKPPFGRNITTGERNNVVDSSHFVSLQHPRAANRLLFLLIIQEIRNSSDWLIYDVQLILASVILMIPEIRGTKPKLLRSSCLMQCLGWSVSLFILLKLECLDNYRC